MSAIELIAQHILSHLTHARPLFVSLQGPQGSGKSYITRHLKSFLQAAPHSLRVAAFSIDDIYLPHSGLVSLAAANPDNDLWQGRGQPGTHDVELGLEILSALKAGDRKVELPRFDKSLFGGEGDRVGGGETVEQPPPVDVVIFEGWCVGFRPINNISARWKGTWAAEKQTLGLKDVRFEDIEAVNSKLHDYLALWDFFDIAIELKPKAAPSSISQYAIVYKWRLEQEHHMKSMNGGIGMDDTAVKSFVDRYIPGYVFFSRPLDSPSASGNGLIVLLDETRLVAETSAF
ncbi:hypothetical protein D9619_001691 [Psilocybe cf. subviscida]|uniref:P-loop containing nucleoside triphosphate hydrolase protein n=1 Tax=Psilocybe cf. subviscida TaxID=2480587 RepID=A0A8H5F3K7_9AGAR|nr:hypothetical protein D9619_001691 [Psilocybe cf. subviscida]